LSQTRYAVVLVRPKSPGNVGAVARLCANFGASELRLVQPLCQWNNTEARERATGWSKQYLERAKVYLDIPNAISRSDSAVAFALNTKKTLNQRVRWADLPKLEGADIALVFGNEREGLNNHEIEACPHHCQIATRADFTAMNLSHSVGVTLSHLFTGEEPIDDPPIDPESPTLAQSNRIEKQARDLLLSAGLDQGGNPDRILRQLRPLIHRAMASEEEATMVEFVLGRINTHLRTRRGS
jgi:tRNA/rRNA methyltransferase